MKNKIPSTSYLHSRGTKTDNMAWNLLVPEILRLRSVIKEIYSSSKEIKHEPFDPMIEYLENEIKCWGEELPGPDDAA